MFREKLILLLVVASSVSLQARWLSSESEYSKKNIFKAIEQHAPNKLIRLLQNTSCNEFNECDLQNATNLARKTALELEIKFNFYDTAKIILNGLLCQRMASITPLIWFLVGMSAGCPTNGIITQWLLVGLFISPIALCLYFANNTKIYAISQL